MKQRIDRAPDATVSVLWVVFNIQKRLGAEGLAGDRHRLARYEGVEKMPPETDADERDALPLGPRLR